jgi:hypothetical protein
LDWLLWNFGRGRCLREGGKRTQGKNGDGKYARKTHEGKLLKDFSVECYRDEPDSGKRPRKFAW